MVDSEVSGKEEAYQIFNNSEINITTEGRKFFGETIGSDSFKSGFFRDTVPGCFEEICVN